MSVSSPQPFASSAGHVDCACRTFVKVTITNGDSTLKCMAAPATAVSVESTLACSRCQSPSTKKPYISDWPSFSVGCMSGEPPG